MTYPNAYAGIKKIRTATILEIISVALLIAAAIFGLFAAGIIGDPTNEIAVDSFSLATVLTVLPVMILPFIALIIQIIGLGAAANESSKFKTAYTIVIISLLVSVINGTLPNFKIDDMEICELIMHILSMLTFYYVVEGIKELCAPLGRNDIVQLANKVAIIYFVGMAAATAIDFFTGDAANFGAIISTIGLILSIVADFMYVSLLGKAADALETA